MSNLEKQGKANAPARLVEVAKLAGVSVATAARVYDKKWDGKVRDTTRERVLEAAQKLGYSGTDAFGSALRTGSSKIVALVMGVTTGYFYYDVMMKFVHELRKSGRQVMIFEVDPVKDVVQILHEIRQYRVDAVIVTSSATQSAMVEGLSEGNIPVVIFNRQTRNNDLCAVYCDGKIASRKVADFLMDRGHRRMALITGNASDSKELRREEGFCERVRERQGEILAIKAGEYNYQSGYRLGLELLQESENRPDALFCAEDSIAMGAMDAARKLGLSVPNDLSIIGFDHIEAGQYDSYNLTTVAHPVERMISCTVDLLDQLMVQPDLKREYVFEMEIIAGGSVKENTICTKSNPK